MSSPQFFSAEKAAENIDGADASRRAIKVGN